MKILVTGGCGYIGAHASVALLEEGHEVVIVDSLISGNHTFLAAITAITGKIPAFYEHDLRDTSALTTVLSKHSINVVMHFAGLKSVQESCQTPLLYYDNNVGGTLSLLKAMDVCGVRSMIFSSSATVYAPYARPPFTEGSPLAPVNPYGRTKLFVEQVLTDWVEAGSGKQAISLRYFNPIGAHASGLIGDDPRGIPANLLPYLVRVATKELEWLPVFGGDYATSDGTGVRDYIHIMDLVEGHLCALDYLQHAGQAQFHKIYNLGSGRGYSVLEVINGFERATGQSVPYKILERRAGDVEQSFADACAANQELSWRAKRNLEDMLRDAWAYEVGN